MVPVRAVMTSAILLGLFAMVGTGLVSGINALTEDQIAENIRQSTLRSLGEVLPADRFDNDILADIVEINDPLLDRHGPAIVHLAQKEGEPVAAIFEVATREGYSGHIGVLVGVNYDGTVSGVRIIQQKETPGLGDDIDQSRSDWILGFEGKSLGDPTEKDWAVKKDGGVFDQFTGATISPRAVVKKVKQTLIYYKQHRDQLFKPAEQTS